MRRLLVLAATAFAAAARAAAAGGRDAYVDRVVGTELPTATSTSGTFVGLATGSLPGSWRVRIEHEPLAAGPRVAVSGGTFVVRSLDGRTVSGRVTDGSVTVRSRGGGCTAQVYAVDAQLTAGRFRGTLTHHRRSFLGSCLIYAATISGSATFTR
jgi:hypothetical protein